MFKKLTALFISILLVVGCMAVPVMAAEEVSLTFNHNSSQADSPNGYILDAESNPNTSGGNVLSAGTSSYYKTFQINIEQAGDYKLLVNPIPFNGAELEFLVDGLSVGGMKFDSLGYSGGTRHYQVLNGISLTQGTHKLRVECTKGIVYLASFTLTRTGDLSKSVPGYAFSLNDAVAVTGKGSYSNLASGWAQFLLPEDYVAGWYKVSMRCAGTTNANPAIAIWVSGEQEASGAASPTKGSLKFNGNFPCTTASSGYSSATYSSPGEIYLDGTNRYVTVKFSEDIRFWNLFLTPVKLSAKDDFNVSSCSLTNASGYNNYGRPYNGVIGNTQLDFSLDVKDAGEYVLKAVAADDNGVEQPVVLKALVNGEEQTSAPITSHTWSKHEFVDLGNVVLPKGNVNFSILGSSDKGTNWQLKGFTLEKSGVGNVIGYKVDSTSFEAIYPGPKFESGSVLQASHWSSYRLSVQKTGMYKITACTAIHVDSSKMNLHVNSEKITQAVPNSGWDNFVDGPTWYVNLTEGENLIRFEATGGAVRFKSFTISPVLQTTVTDSQSTVLTALGTRTDDTLTIKGPEGKTTDVVMIAALYNGDTLINADVATVEGSQLVASLSNVTIADTDKCNLKVYYWDSLETMTPVSSYYIIK